MDILLSKINKRNSITSNISNFPQISQQQKIQRLCSGLRPENFSSGSGILIVSMAHWHISSIQDPHYAIHAKAILVCSIVP